MEEDLNVMRYFAIPCHADALIYPILSQSKHTHTHQIDQLMAFCFSLALSNIWYEGNERLSTSYHYACQTTWLLCSSVLPFNFALQHMFAHFTNPNPVLVLFISNCCFDACINGFFFLFSFEKKLHIMRVIWLKMAQQCLTTIVKTF